MTVTGTILDSKGTARASCPMRFTPLSTLGFDAGGVLTSTAIETSSDGSGAFTVTLKSGWYLWSVGYNKRDKAALVVDDSSASVDVRSLIVPSGNLDRFYAKGNGNNYQKWSGKFQLYNQATALFNEIKVTGGPGSEVVDFSDGNTVSPAIRWRTGLSTFGGNYQVNGGYFQIKNDTVAPATYHNLWVNGGLGAEALYFEAGAAEGPSAGLAPLQMMNARIRNGYFQMKHLTSGKYYTVFATGDDGAVVPAFGQPET